MNLDFFRSCKMRTGKHADDGEENLFDRLHRTPPLRARFVAVRVVSRRMKNRNANAPVAVDCRRQTSQSPERNKKRRDKPFGWSISQVKRMDGGLSG